MALAGQSAGKASPIYTSWYRTEQTALNIQRHLPNVKLIVVLRHPALRAWSDYNYQRQLGDEPCLTFREALDAEPQRANWFPDFSYFKTGDLQLFIFFTHTTNPSHISRQRHAGEGEVDDHLVRHGLSRFDSFSCDAGGYPDGEHPVRYISDDDGAGADDAIRSHRFLIDYV